MLYNDDTVNYGHVDDSVFILEDRLGFDFSDKSPVTFVYFNGMGTHTPIAKSLRFWKNFYYKRLAQHINVMIVRDEGRQYNRYSANFLGVLGVCEDTVGISNFLNEKLYVKGTTKRTVVFADCGGAFPAVCSSVFVPIHSLNLTTPYLKVIGNDQELTTAGHTVWIAKEQSVWVWNELSHMNTWFDTATYLEQYCQNPSSQLNMHWATNVLGSDLMFRHTAEHLKKYPNVTITDHVMPPGMEGHLLQKYLIESNKFFSLVGQELRVQFAALNIEVKSRVCNSNG